MNINNFLTIERDKLTRIFLPENKSSLLNRHDWRMWDWTLEEMEQLVRVIMGTENVRRIRSTGNPLDDKEWTPEAYIDCKESELFDIYFRYSKIFDLCRVLGVTNLYDIGCDFINQSFILCDYSNFCYTGIDNWGFKLNDYRKQDYKNENIYFPYTNETPLPFCGGRIRFVKAEYPFKIDAPAGNIAISCYSLTNTTDPDEIYAISEAFARDFERVLFNTYQDSVEIWKNSVCKCFDFYPIGHNRFVFGTKIPEDIIRLKEIYPFSDAKFSTGIDNYMEYDNMNDEDTEGDFGYIHW